MSSRNVRVAMLVGALVLAACDDDPTTTSGTGSGGATSASSASTTHASTTSTATASTSGGTGGAGGCGGGTPPPPTGSPIANPDDPCATLTMAGEPDERVVFLDRGEDSTFSSAIELMWAWRWAARVPAGTEGTYEVEQERCSQPAGEPETCDVLPLAPLTASCSGPTFGPKFAVDPSQYNPGENVYRITLRLRQGCEIKSEDSFTMKLTYSP